MADPTNIDPNAPPPWSWVPDDWRVAMGNPSDEQLAALAPPPPDGMMQPGLGIPAATLDAAAAAPGHPDLALQPGLGIPQATLDAAIAAPPYHPAVGELVGPTTEMMQPFGAQPVPYGVPVPPDEAARSLPSEATAVRPPVEDPNQPASPLASLSPEQARDLAIKDPVQFGMLVAGQEQDWKQHYARQQQLLDEQHNYQSEMALKAMAEAHARTQAKMDGILKRSEALERERIDPNRQLNSRSTGRHIADFIGAIAGGAAAGQVPGGNGVNHYVDWMQKDIDRDIDAQKFDIENRRQGLSAQRGMVAEEFARTGNMYQATQAVRLASYTAARNDLLTQQQLYDPRGRRAAAIGQAAGEMSARIATAQQQMHQQQLETELKVSKQQLEYQQQQLTDRHLRVDEKIGQQNANTSAWGKSIEQQNNLANQELKAAEITATALKEKDKKADAEADKDRELGVLGPPSIKNGKVTYDPLRNADGTVARAKTPELSKAISEKKSATDTIVQLMDEALRMRTGWSNSVKDRDEWQRISSNWALAKAKGKDALGLGALSEEDYKLLDGFLGSSDPTKVLSPVAGIKKARANILQMFNNDLRGYTTYNNDRPYDIEDTSSPPPPRETVEDARVKRALRDEPSEAALDNQYGAWSKKWAGDHGGWKKAAETYGSNRDAAKAAREDYDSRHKVLPSTEQTINELARNAFHGKDPADRSTAEAHLAQLAEHGPNGATRDYAQAQLNSGRAAKPSPESVEPQGASEGKKSRLPAGGE